MIVLFKPGDLLIYKDIIDDYSLVLDKTAELSFFQNLDGSISSTNIYFFKPDSIHHYSYYTDIFRELSVGLASSGEDK